MKLVLSPKWPTKFYRDHTNQKWMCGEVREVSEKRGAELLEQHPDYFSKASAKTEAAGAY